MRFPTKSKYRAGLILSSSRQLIQNSSPFALSPKLVCGASPVVVLQPHHIRWRSNSLERLDIPLRGVVSVREYSGFQIDSLCLVRATHEKRRARDLQIVDEFVHSVKPEINPLIDNPLFSQEVKMCTPSLIFEFHNV